MKRVKKRPSKNKPNDDLFSYLIRTRAMKRVGGCERCLTAKINYKALHCAHNQPRGRLSTRWHEDNAAGLCPGCHRYIDNNHDEKREFFVKLLGEDRYEYVRIQSLTPQKVDRELWKLYLDLKVKEYEMPTLR